MSGVERLQKVERLRAAHLADEDPVRTMPQRRSHQVGDRHRRHRLFLAERRLRSSRLEPDEIRLVDPDLGRLLDQDDAVLRRDRLRDGVEERRLARARPAGDEDVVAGVHGRHEASRRARSTACRTATRSSSV